MGLVLMQGVAPAAIRDIVTRLRHVPCEEFCTDVSPAVASDLTELKHALRDLISQTVAVAADSPAEELRARVVGQLEREDVPVGDDGGYGVISSIKFDRPKEFPEWLIASVILAIPYGNDTSLYIYRLRGNSRRPVMAIESERYKQIGDAPGWLEYRVGRLPQTGEPFLITTGVTPSPASVWQGLRLRVWRVGPSPDQPVRLLSRTLGYCIEEPYYVALNSGGIGLIYPGWAVPPQIAGYRGVHYLEYSIKVGGATVVRDAGVDPDDLVKRWARYDVPKSASPETREWHLRLREPGWECGVGNTRMGVRTEQGREQLLAMAGCEKDGGNTPAAYAVFAPDSRGFRVVSVTSKPPEWLPDWSGTAVWNTGPDGATEAVAISTVEPVLPSGLANLAPVKVRLSIVVKDDGSVDSVSVENWPDQVGLVMPRFAAYDNGNSSQEWLAANQKTSPKPSMSSSPNNHGTPTDSR